ncbi:MAG: bifunctional phosphoribosylaminoimidazolecarboxamide formyltransferase/IMP cyclohydrolase [Bacteroidetes bacterium GWA2_30_7]|nr:MAG: bifunctional phosphoribosylaminoimidazolecarboxamide formyltransferase/IMP cyclohydrolase [Bacteroidetes bacterium GWA2_30_7]
MSELRQIKNALISVYYKDGLDVIVKKLNKLGVVLYSTGGTKTFIESLNIPVISVESITGYPSILGGRVKTLHPKIFGGILSRRDNTSDILDLSKFSIPVFDLVIVDLYPFEETVKSGAAEEDIIEKIDVGGVSLIRAAAKNFKDVLIIPSRDNYNKLSAILDSGAETDIETRKQFAGLAFKVSSHYDSEINKFFSTESPSFNYKIEGNKQLRYGENPHQKGEFFGNFNNIFDQLNGKELSYNNLLDIDSAVGLINDFDEPTFAVIKHNNACGIATDHDLKQAWEKALAGDPVSAFGGIIVTNQVINKEVAEEINKIFFEIVIAPAYENDAVKLLSQKKNRIILVNKIATLPAVQFRSILNGVLLQDRDNKVLNPEEVVSVTEAKFNKEEISDLIFANKIVKHTKSNAIVMVKDKQLLGSGIGQTSRVDSLKQSIAKAQSFGFDLNGAVMASDAFFPFADSVQIAYEAGIKAVIQPGGSIRDNDTIEFCNKHQIKMALTGIRHFKH